MASVTENASINWYKNIAIYIGSLNLFVFCSGVVYLTIMQGYFVNEGFLAWSFSLEDAFFRGWILLMSDYPNLFLSITIVFLPLISFVYYLYKRDVLIIFCISFLRFQSKLVDNIYLKFGVNRGEKERNKKLRKLENQVVTAIVIAVIVLFVLAYVFWYIVSISHCAERDAKNLQSSAIACQTLPSSNCYSYKRVIKESQEKHELLGALVYKNADSIWLLDDKGLLHMVAAKDYELSKVSEKKFELD